MNSKVISLVVLLAAAVAALFYRDVREKAAEPVVETNLSGGVESRRHAKVHEIREPRRSPALRIGPVTASNLVSGSSAPSAQIDIAQVNLIAELITDFGQEEAQVIYSHMTATQQFFRVKLSRP